MSQVPISALPPLATPLNPALQFEVAQGTTTSSKVTLTQILTDPIITGSPTIDDFTLAIHDHSNNVNGGQLTNTALIQGEFSSITGIGTQTTDINMGINNILQSGFLELREITKPSDPAETAGRLYTRDVANNTILFFLNNLGVETDLLDIGTGTFLPLAGGTMDDGAAIAFTNTGSGDDPTISVIPSDGQTLTISDNLLVPKIIFLGNAGWNMDINDADTDFVIKSPEGDGSHNFDIISDNGEISLQNTTLTNDFTAKFFVEQFSALATTQAIALTIEAQIIDGTDEGSNPVIAINARQAVADIDTRPIFGILNNGTKVWEISKDGDVTQFGDLDMDDNTITFQNWKIDDQISNTELNIGTILGGDGTVSFFTNELKHNLIFSGGLLSFNIFQQGAVETTNTVFTNRIAILPDNDTETEPIYVIRILREGGVDISARPLLQVQNNATVEWLLDNDGTVTQFGDLIMGSKEIQFEDASHRILQNGNNLEIHSLSTGNTTLFLGGTFYRFDKDKADFERKSILNMNQIAFSNTGSQGTALISIQRGDSTVGGNNESLELDANTGGEIVLRVANEEEYNFGDGAADFHFNDILMRDFTISAASGGPQIQIFTSVDDIAVSLEVGRSSTQNIAIGGSENTTLLTYSTFITSEILGANSAFNVVVLGNATSDNVSTTNAVIEMGVNHGGLKYVNRPILSIQNFTSLLWLLDNDGTVTQFGDLDMVNNDLINMGILEFSNSKNRLSDSAGGSKLEIQADSEISLKIEGTSQFFNVDASFIEWKADNGSPPTFITRATQSSPTPARPVTIWNYEGQSDASTTRTYANMEVIQAKIEDGLEEGSMVFKIMQTGSLLPFMILNGEDGRLDLQKDIGLTFRNADDDNFLLIEINEFNNLLFETARVKTSATSQLANKLAPDQTITSTAVLIAGLSFKLPNQLEGKGLLTVILLVNPNTNNDQGDFKINADDVTFFEKRISLGNSSGDANPITFVVPIDLKGQTITIEAVAVSGTFVVKGSDTPFKNSSYMTVFQVF